MGPREKGGREETECLVSGKELLVVGPRVGSPLAPQELPAGRFHWKGGGSSTEK